MSVMAKRASLVGVGVALLAPIAWAIYGLVGKSDAMSLGALMALVTAAAACAAFLAKAFAAAGDEDERPG